MNKPMTCPLCKYCPRTTRNGRTFKYDDPFKEVGTAYEFVAYSCPKRGILFREVEKVNK